LDLRGCTDNILKCHELDLIGIPVFVGVLLIYFESVEMFVTSVMLNLEMYLEIWCETFLHFDLFVSILLNHFDLHVNMLFELVELLIFFVSVLSNCCKSKTLISKYVMFIRRKRASCFERTWLSCEFRI